MDTETNVITAILGIENDTHLGSWTSQPRYLRIHTRATGGLLLELIEGESVDSTPVAASPPPGGRKPSKAKGPPRARPVSRIRTRRTTSCVPAGARSRHV